MLSHSIDTPQTAANLRWLPPAPLDSELQALARSLGLPDWFATVLFNRGLTTKTDILAFLHPHADALHDPNLMRGMQRGVERILHAIVHREAILIYGDYDVDGTLATVLLKTAIDRLTPKPAESLVRYHIPHRIREGYGVQTAVLADAAAQGVRLVISVDTGIRAFAAAAEARAIGLDLIVTDHHLPDGLGVPEAIAVINPNQADCEYPFKDLCGAAVAFKVAAALLLHAARHPAAGLQPIDEQTVHTRLLPSLLKLVAIATVADAVPLHGENRVITALGLRALKQVHQPGLRALLHYAQVVTDDDEHPTATAIAFRVAPRINAAGRMDIASDVVRMLLTRDPAEGDALAQKLHLLNTDRRDVEASVLKEIDTLLDAMTEGDLATAGCLVLDGDGWHRGVVGILASRVVERTNRPALVITHQDGKAHGSGRSIAGFHLLDAITAAHLSHTLPPLFDRFGGHAHAVGFSLPSANVPHLRRQLTAYASTRLTSTMLQPTLALDVELPLTAIGPAALAALKRLEPFGHAAAEPIFLATRVTVRELRTLKDTHVKLHLQQDESPVVQCLGWSRKIQWPQRLQDLKIAVGSVIDIAFNLRENRHPDFGGPQLQLCDLRLHHSDGTSDV